jgi:hypothetical protein
MTRFTQRPTRRAIALCAALAAGAALAACGSTETGSGASTPAPGPDAPASAPPPGPDASTPTSGPDAPTPDASLPAPDAPVPDAPAPDAPAPTSGTGAPDALVLPDDDALYLANVALETWALGRSAVGYQLDGCSRIDPATADCATTIEFADNPTNPQTCSLAITVVAAAPTVGIKEPTPADPTLGLETEEYELPSGGYGTYMYGDEAACDQAQYDSGF